MNDEAPCLASISVARLLGSAQKQLGDVKGMAGIVVLSFLLLIVILLAFFSASSSEIPIVCVPREDDYGYDYD